MQIFDRRRSPKILVADDDPFSMDMIAASLKQVGCEVFRCRDGIEALAQAQKATPTAIVLDLQMPNMDGLAFLEARLKLPDIQNIPTLVLTATRSVDTVRRAIDLGAVDYLAKPFSGFELVHRVNRLLRRAPLTPLSVAI